LSSLRYAAAAAILLATTAGTIALLRPADLSAQLRDRIRSTLESQDPARHHHAGHAPTAASAPVVCEIHVYGFEPAEATRLTAIRTAYAFHFCGIAEPRVPWDVAVKLAGPLVMDLTTDPPAIQVVERTGTTSYADRLTQLFPARFAELARTEALTPADMATLRERYEDAAG
jgi:hypothetical protein